MATATIPLPTTDVPGPSAGPPEGDVYRMTADQYFRAIDADVFPSGLRIGLWEGQFYEKMAKKLPHSIASAKIASALMRTLPGNWMYWPENPILIDDFTAPVPDATVVRGEPDDYSRRGSVPKVEDIGLVVELAETSLKKNLTKTLEKYARARLPVYWIINLIHLRVEVFEDPRVDATGLGSYARTSQYVPGQEVPLVLDGREVARIPVNALLPVVESAP